jgi:Streptomyces sporulation and cell division protein, SsgA
MRVVSATVTRELSVHVVAPIDGPSEVTVEMRYDTADPFAVHAVFQVAPGQQIAWVFGRELLAEGLDLPAGDGDVRIWPASDAGREVVCIVLRSPDGEALLHASTPEIVAFLSSAYALCARGREARHLEIDRGLSALLAT